MPHQRTRPVPGAEPFLLASQVADLLQVSSNMAAHWAQQGLLPDQHPLGGHRRSSTATIEQLTASLAQEVRAS
jgi:DNA-binding transcriptional MerR regulator